MTGSGSWSIRAISASAARTSTPRAWCTNGTTRSPARPGGPVVLSWESAANAPEMNVVLHEFAHKLDMRNGAADGLPPLHADMDRRRWHAAWQHAYEGFCDALERARDTWLDPYAAEHPSEFFAVLSEAFFEWPQETQRRYPDVYDQLRLFYRQDPAARAKP
jgi:Mlc titration factor MtfA (ptsG expression regulator)